MKRISIILLAMFLGMVSLGAQNSNSLFIPDLTAQAGSTVKLPLDMDNTSEVVAVEFTIRMPEGSTLDTSTARLTNRATDHSVTFRGQGTGTYHGLVYSPTNSPLLGRTGEIMAVNMTVNEDYAEGTLHSIELTDIVLVLRDGSNGYEHTGPNVSTLMIQKGPDIYVHEVQTDAVSYVPGTTAVISWQVTNIGDLATGGGWTEYVTLKSHTGVSTLLSTTTYNEAIAPENAVSRQVEVKLPFALGMDGDVEIEVEARPHSTNGESKALRLNNVAVTSVTISKALNLTLPTGAVAETYSRPVQCVLTRSGNCATAETFPISATADSRVNIPAEVTIPAGQSSTNFYIELKDNSVLDENDIVHITLSGNSYPEVSGALHIEDNEYPDLKVAASSSQVREGDTFQLTITATRIPVSDLEVTLTAEVQNRFRFPAKVTIPAGQSSVTVDVTVTEDDVPGLTLSNAFIAYAPEYNKGEAIVIVEDDDIPVLELTLSPNQVSESVGPVAVAATLRRTGVTNNKITVKLSDDSNGGIYYGKNTIEMAKGVEEVHFNLGPIDNANVDGDRVVNITAAVYISSCSCNAQGESAGVVFVPLTILDDDGPALTLKPSSSTVKEGGKVALTVSRNTTTSGPLTVTLNGDKDEMFDAYDHTLTIPAGAASASVELTSKSNDVSDDSFTAVFTATTEGFSKGSCFLMVTDQTLPDARIASITAEQTEVEVGRTTVLTIVVNNEGAAPLPAGTPVTLYEIGTSRTLRTSRVLAVGETEPLTATVTLPTTIGSGRYYAVINESNAVKELNYNNNTSASVTIRTIAPFSASVSTEKAVYGQGETVQITGQLTGNQTANQAVEVYIINDGTRQTVTTQTDATGAFNVEWTPYSTQSGHFIVGACFRGENLRQEMAAFDMYGLKTGSSYVELYTTVGETKNGSLRLSNPGRLKLTGVRAELISEIEGTTITLDVPSEIAAGGTVQMNYTVLASKASLQGQWDKAEVRISTAEGVVATALIKNFAQNPHGNLVSSTGYIKTTVLMDSFRDYPLDIVNTGKGNSGPITLALPSNMTCLSGTKLAALESGETASIILRFLPTDNMQLNIPVKGSFGINCTNGNGTSVSFDVTPVSEATGTLVVDVMDENTYYTAEAPHVSGASVELRNPATNALVAQGVTGADGLYTITLPEGYYQLTVTSANHDSYRNNILVDPGVETRKDINLSIQAIKVNWEVEETTVEDEYEIVTTVTFETNVPTPVVELNVPKRIAADELQEGESLIFYATLTNKGLITAKDAELLLPEGFTHLTFEPLAEYTGLTIAPQQAITIPVKVTRVNGEAMVKGKGNRVRHIDNDPCVGQPGTLYYWDCGTDRKWHRYGVAMQVGSCNSNDPSTWDSHSSGSHSSGSTGSYGSGGGSWGPYGGTGGGYYSSSASYGRVSTAEDTGCEPCQNSFLYKMAKCLVKRIPVVKEVLEFVDNVKCAYDVVTKGDLCWIEKLPIISTITEWVDFYDECIRPLIEPCNPGDFEGESTPLPWRIRTRNGAGTLYNQVKRQAQSTYPSYITDFQMKAAIVFDAIDAYMQQGLEICGEECWMTVSADSLALIATSMSAYVEGNLTEAELNALRPSTVTQEQFERLLQRWVNTLNEKDDENIINLQQIQELEHVVEKARELADEEGSASIADFYVNAENDVMEKLQEATSSVCASITLQFKQSMYLTRQAFRGTLTVFNGHESTAMEDVRLHLSVVSEDGSVATSREFEMHGESIDVFHGDVDLTSGWTLDAQQTGTATVLFIPSKYAAPTEPVQYSFGGTLTYTDPFTGLEVTRILTPITLTVKPTAELDLTYFMQRDVYGDDPLTEEVEPCEPAEFSLLINNIGYGDATNVRMVTNQPQIVDNEKGLKIDFELLSAQLNGGDKTLALGGSIPTDFGTIPARSQTCAQWWFQSSLLGHFTDYDVQATHVTSYDNPDLSLLNQVTIHELIRSIKVDDGTVTGFMVNDLPDAKDAPDMLYFTDGTTAEVSIAASAVAEKRSQTEYLLTITPSQAGWNYGHITDPTFGRATLMGIRRQSDGKEIHLRNFWQTDRTLCDGKDWLYENNLHFVDQMANRAETYVLTFEPKPVVELQVVSISGLPEEGMVLQEPLQTVTVTFNKAIDAETFTRDDITLDCQGLRVAAPIIISQVSDTQFSLDLSQASTADGYYVLTIQTAGIVDIDGFVGAVGKQSSWTQFEDGKVILKVIPSPAEGGSVAPSNGRFAYDSDVLLSATPAEGYDFSGWSLNGETLSSSNEFTYHLMAETELMAIFAITHYDVTVDCDNTQGTVSGGGSGVYDFGALLQLTAEPCEDFRFDCWVINGQRVTDGRTLVRTIDGPLNIQAQFVRDIYHQDIQFQRGWNWVSTYLKETQPLGQIAVQASRVLSQYDELIRDPNVGMMGGIEHFDAGVAYKVNASSSFTSSFKGHLYDLNAIPMNVQCGWNWIAYPYYEGSDVDMLKNAEEGDYIISQTGFTEYADGYWQGTLEHLYPGVGYLYMSASDKSLVFDFTAGSTEVKGMSQRSSQKSGKSVDTRKYPHTMNVTAQLIYAGMDLADEERLVYAMAGDELRGVGTLVGGLYYFTIYGEDPVEISFYIVDAETQVMLEANESLEFFNDVVGSRNAPYQIRFGNATGLNQHHVGDGSMTVVRPDGVLMHKEADQQTLHKLPKGIYIINGNKRLVK